jgi:hypothetical protein
MVWSHCYSTASLGRCCQHLATFAADPASQLDVLGHDGHPFGVDGAEVGVLEEAYEVRLRRLLQRSNGGTLVAGR